MTQSTPEQDLALERSVQVSVGLRIPAQDTLRLVRDLSHVDTVTIGQIPFAITTFDSAVEWLLVKPAREAARSVRLANAYCVTQAHRDPRYASLLAGAGVNLPDGTPIQWAMRIPKQMRSRTIDRVRGPSLFVETLERSQGTRTVHFMLGGSPDTVRRLKERVATRYPGAQIAEMYSPPFAPVSEELLEEWALRIRRSGATLVWVGLGSPKQDFVSSELASRVGLHCVGVGAAFDFLAGTRREAPAWVQKHALEWLFRLCTEPRRLWRRYVFGNLRFMAIVMRQLPGWWTAGVK